MTAFAISGLLDQIAKVKYSNDNVYSKSVNDTHNVPCFLVVYPFTPLLSKLYYNKNNNIDT